MTKFEKSVFCELFVELKSRPLFSRKTWYEYKTVLCSFRMSFKISMKFAANSKENFMYGLTKKVAGDCNKYKL